MCSGSNRTASVKPNKLQPDSKGITQLAQSLMRITVRVLVVDDSAFMRKIISEMISKEPGFEVVAIARDGEDGVQKAIENKPDLITLDIEMPRKNGLDARRV